jgi:hypothetical protein
MTSKSSKIRDLSSLLKVRYGTTSELVVVGVVKFEDSTSEYAAVLALIVFVMVVHWKTA